MNRKELIKFVNEKVSPQVGLNFSFSSMSCNIFTCLSKSSKIRATSFRRFFPFAALINAFRRFSSEIIFSYKFL